jgi:ATP-dependent Clp protease protease subunit
MHFFNAVMPGPVDSAIAQLHKWAVRDPGQPITITFNTPGGSIVDGLAFYDTILQMRRAGHRVTTRAIGMAASMGSVLMQAGDERIMDARAKMLIHEGSMMVGGNVGEVEDRIEFGKMLREDLFDILAERSTLTKKQILTRAKRKDWWFGADEALKMGFIDRVE